MYKVIEYFTDLQDKDHAYNVGDTYPRKGLKVTKERIEELSGSENKQKKPLIEEIVEENVEENTDEKKAAVKKATTKKSEEVPSDK